MTIRKLKRQKTYLNNLLKYLPLILFFFLTNISAQEKIGFQFGKSQEDNFLFNDSDYSFEGFSSKVQLFYPIKKLGKWDFNLIIQPQIHIYKHQLLNPSFVKPEDYANYLELRERFTKKKTLSVYAIELGFQLRRAFLKNINFEFTAALGAGYIDVFTERVANGFTFIENLSFGLSHTFKKSELYIGTNFEHISNLDINLPNSGYDLLGWEVSYRFFLNKKGTKF